MKRWVLTILVLLLAGAVVNIGVAWGSAAWVSPVGQYRDVRSTQITDSTWRWVVEYEAPCSRRILVSGSLYLFSDSVVVEKGDLLPFWAHMDPLSEDFRGALQDARGWPVVSMYCEFVNSNGDWVTSLRHGGATLPPSSYPAKQIKCRALPLRPVWIGSAVNMIFYAVILWVLVATPIALRRLIRRRRGLCPWCAYPMGESPVCSECGKPLPGRAEAVA